jgi:hypothetical protein
MVALIGKIASLILRIIRHLGERPIGLSGESVYLITDRILVREYPPDEIVLFDCENRNVYLLNHTAAAVIRLTDGTRNLEYISRKVAWDFNEETHVAVGDIRKIYRELLKKGVITMAPDRSLVPRFRRETVIREEDDGAFIFDPITDALSAANETGLLILRQIDGKKTLAEITNTVAAHFSEIEPEQIRRDVEAFIDELVSRGLIDT